VYGANILLACLCLALFFADASLFPLSSVAAAQRTLPPRWQTGGCRRVAAGGWLQADGWLLADGWLQADGPWQTGRATRRGGHVQDFLACWGGGARGWSSCCYGGQRGSGQLRLALMFGLLYSVKLTATNPTEFFCE